jgi:hypothetical protein
MVVVTMLFLCARIFFLKKIFYSFNYLFLLYKEILGDCGRAAIQTQGSMNNPFGSTFVYGYQNIAFEVATESIKFEICFPLVHAILSNIA